MNFSANPRLSLSLSIYIYIYIYIYMYIYIYKLANLVEGDPKVHF